MTDVFKDSTSHTYYFELVDSSTGLPKTAIVYTDATASYVRTRSARAAITPATLASASAAWSSGGFILVDDTNQPGVCRFDVPDAAFATGADEVIVTVKATGCRTQSRKFTLVNLNNQVAYAPNAAANADGGLPILSSSGTTLGYTVSTLTTYTGNTPQTGDHTANIAAILADTNELQTDWVNGGRLDLILDARSSQTSVDDLPTNAELTTALDVIPTAAALWDLSDGIETSITPRQAMRLILAAAAGKLSGAATTTITIRNVGDSKDRLTATVDADGNRSAVTVDGT